MKEMSGTLTVPNTGMRTEMEIWFTSKETGKACLFISDNLLTQYMAQRVADNIKDEGWADEVWIVEL